MIHSVDYWYKKYLEEENKVAELEERIKIAEDAFHAESGIIRKRLIKKVCEFIESNVREYHKSGVFHVADFIKDIKKVMEE